MGTIYRNDAEGAASGTAVTTANSDDNNAGDALNLSTGGTRIYDNAWSNTGSTSFKVTTAAAETALLGWNVGTQVEGVFRGYFRITANPASTVDVVQGRTAASNVVQVQITAAGKVQVSTAADSATLYTSTASMSFDTTYRFELRVVRGTTTSNGTVVFGWYLGDSLTPVESLTTRTDVNTRTTGNIEGFRWGQMTSGPAYSVWVDDVAYEDGGTTFLGPRLGNGVVAATTSRQVKVDTTGSNGTMTLVQTAGTTATISGPTAEVFTITRPAYHADVLTFDLTATGDTVDTEVITIYPDNLTNELVFTGGDPSVLSNWE